MESEDPGRGHEYFDNHIAWIKKPQTGVSVKKKKTLEGISKTVQTARSLPHENLSLITSLKKQKYHKNKTINLSCNHTLVIPELGKWRLEYTRRSYSRISKPQTNERSTLKKMRKSISRRLAPEIRRIHNYTHTNTYAAWKHNMHMCIHMYKKTNKIQLKALIYVRKFFHGQVNTLVYISSLLKTLDIFENAFLFGWRQWKNIKVFIFVIRRHTQHPSYAF